jgi:hypothetical protein
MSYRRVECERYLPSPRAAHPPPRRARPALVPAERAAPPAPRPWSPPLCRARIKYHEVLHWQDGPRIRGAPVVSQVRHFGCRPRRRPPRLSAAAPVRGAAEMRGAPALLGAVPRLDAAPASSLRAWSAASAALGGGWGGAGQQRARARRRGGSAAWPRPRRLEPEAVARRCRTSSAPLLRWAGPSGRRRLAPIFWAARLRSPGPGGPSSAQREGFSGLLGRAQPLCRVLQPWRRSPFPPRRPFAIAGLRLAASFSNTPYRVPESSKPAARAPKCARAPWR